MKYILHINQAQAIKLGMTNTNQAIIFDLLTTASTWAEAIIHDNKVYYWVARQVVVRELPLLNLKEDTVYRHLKSLDKIDLISYIKVAKKDCINITKKGKKYISETMSEINPNRYVGNKSELGNESELNSDLNPTYQYTNIIKEEEKEEYKKYIKKISSSEIEYEIFALEFYDYIYPNNKKANQQKIFYGNKVKENIQKSDIQTMENIKNFLEYQELEKFKYEQHRKRKDNVR